MLLQIIQLVKLRRYRYFTGFFESDSSTELSLPIKKAILKLNEILTFSLSLCTYALNSLKKATIVRLIYREAYNYRKWSQSSQCFVSLSETTRPDYVINFYSLTNNGIDRNSKEEASILKDVGILFKKIRDTRIIL
jgi:hypothetical protein